MERMLSVTEYANLTGRDPGNIRRMLAAGRLEGSKVGKQWIIPYGAEYPVDRRQKSGKYRNWRKKIELNTNRELMLVIKRLVKDFVEIYGDILREVIIYGSYARGEQTSESDVDIALILRGNPSREMRDRMIDLTAAGELESGMVLSVLDIQSDKYEKWKSAVPFYKNIEKEGITIWKKA